MVKYLFFIAVIVFVVMNLGRHKPRSKQATHLRERGMEAMANITEKHTQMIKGALQHFLHVNVLIHGGELLVNKVAVSAQTYARYNIDDDIYVRFDPQNPQIMLASEDMA
jgi:hypothetical protein